MPLKNNPMVCKNQTDFGDLTFVMNGFEYTLPNDDWVNKIPDYENQAAQVKSELMGQTKIYNQVDESEKVEAAQVGPMSMGLIDTLMSDDQQLSQTQTGPIREKETL